MAALNLPSAGDVERLERRLRSFSERIDDLEDQIDRVAREVGELQSQRARQEQSLTLDFRVRVRPRRRCRPVSRRFVQRLVRERRSGSPLGDDQQRRGRDPERARRGRGPRRSACRRPSAPARQLGRRARAAGRSSRRSPPASAPSSSRRRAVSVRVGRDRLADREPEGGGRAALGDRPLDQEQLAGGAPCAGGGQVPTRTARRTPSSASSARTSAALGPPIPVDWIVSSPPARRPPRVAPEPAGVVAHLRLLEQLLGEEQGAAGVADQHGVGGDRRGGAEPGRHRRRPSCQP